MLRIMFAAVVFALMAPVAFACSQPAGAAGLEQGMIAWINQQRAAKGLNTLSGSGALEAAATSHACDMAVRGYFAHQRAGGPDLGARLKSNGFRFRTAAENIAKTRAADVSSAAVIWRDSSAHWANILKPDVTQIGLGTALGSDGRTYWVMNVGRSR